MNEYMEDEMYESYWSDIDEADMWRQQWLDEQADAMIDYAYEDEDYDYNPENY